MLRSIPNKLIGVLTMFGSNLVCFLLPWLDKSKVKSGAYRPLFKKFFWAFVVNFAHLTWLGGQEVKEPYITLSRLSTLY
jgi:ubiquinol-cytochrome c reductase cytochrome b subunit